MSDMPQDLPLVDGLRVVRLGVSDRARLSALCAACTDFFELIEGQPGGDATAAELLGPLEPPHADKPRHVWGLEEDEQLIGVIELLQGHPLPEDWYIGLLLLDPAHRRRGLGAKVGTATVNWIRSHGGALVRLVVQKQNPDARAFWERQGFSVEREVVKQFGRRESAAWILSTRREVTRQ
jgi:ribosomal protein S18 acetylase RimI-like enzyme